MRSLLTAEDVLIAASDAIKDRRIRLRWRQIDLAKESGVAPVTLRRFERTGKITFEGFAKVAAAVGLAEGLVQLFRKRDEEVSSVADFVKQGEQPKRVRLSRRKVQ